MRNAYTIRPLRRFTGFLFAVVMMLALLSALGIRAAAEEAAAETVEDAETAIVVETTPEEAVAPAEETAFSSDGAPEGEDPGTGDPAEEAQEQTQQFLTDANGKTYYLNADGSRHKGWLYKDGLWYYFWSDGTMATGWAYANDGYWYYFEPDTGVVHRGWATCAGKTYYMRPEDAREQTGWRMIDGYWYYFWSDGSMATGWAYTNDGYWYYFEPDTGIVHRGWTTCGGYTYYMRPEDAREQKYWREIDGYWYYFGSDGKMRTGWQYIGTDYYYFYTGAEADPGPVGSNAHDVVIDGRQVLSNGAIADGSKVRMKEIAEYYTSSTRYLILVDTTACKTGIFYGSWRNWDLWYFWDCSPGAYSTPTVKGVFTVKSRGYFFDSYGARCYWYTQFYGNYLFHSVLYYPSGGLMDGRLGMNLSHGCVRLAYDNAYWINQNIPSGTTVVIY